MGFQEILVTAKAMVANDKGLLAMDESNPTCNKRFAAIAGIVFLSGGQSPELASTRLNAMNVRSKSRRPWALTFSFARAIQQPALEIWRGQEANVSAAQGTLYHRALCNRAARCGKYSNEMEGK
jgi:fructose-bisphosphate aldolase class I